MPRIVTVGIHRTDRRSAADRPQAFTVSLHEEGTPVSWLRDVAVPAATRRELVEDLTVLDDWTQGKRSDPQEAVDTARRLGRRLFDTFLGSAGADYLADHRPTALMIDADETDLDLPWELVADGDGPLALRYPLGRIVSTRSRPRPERDPTAEDAAIAVLAVVDPSRDMRDVEEELDSLRRLGELGALALDVLQGDRATHAALVQSVGGTRYDIVHFSGHGGFAADRPGDSGLLLADGPLLTKDILDLPWAAPPYLAITSACWSARAAAGRRLGSGSRGTNGVAAAFLSAGASSCLGFGWPVTMRGASRFVGAFFDALVAERNVGLAVLAARRATVADLWELGDLAGLGAVFYGDVGTSERRDVPTTEASDTAPTGHPDRPGRRDITMAEPPDDDGGRRDLYSAS